MWRRQDANEEIGELIPGICITILTGTRFQFQSSDEALEAVTVTMPPWPTQEEAVLVIGRWPAVL